MSKTLTRVEDATTLLVLDEPFFAALVMNWKVIEHPDDPERDTFSTDGKHMWVNPEFCATLQDGQVKTACAHEGMHCGLGHFWRMTPTSHPDEECRQQAADYEVNEMLEDANKQARAANKPAPFPFPEGALLADRFRGMACEAIYTVLVNEKKKGGGKQPGQQPGQKLGQGKSGQPGKQPGQPGRNMGRFEPYPGPQSEQKKAKQDWERRLIQAVQSSKNKGHVPGAMQRLVEQLTKTVVDWKAITREFCRRAHDDYSFLHPNRRYADSEFIMPSLHSERLGKLAFFRDASGSITSHPALLSEFIGQEQLVLDELLPEALVDACFDTRITCQTEYVPGDTIKNEIKGGGGTDFRPIFQNLPDDILAVIVLTDMYGTFPETEPDVPTLWVSYGGREQPPFGQLVIVEFDLSARKRRIIL